MSHNVFSYFSMLTFEVPDPARVRVVTCEERVMTELAESVATLGVGTSI